MLSAMMASWSVDNETSPKRIQEKFTAREGSGFLAPSVSRLVQEAGDIEDAYGVKPLAQFTCGVGDSREQLRQIQEPVAFPQLVSDLGNLVEELLAKGE